MKILITGKSGYIAKSLYNNLKDKYDITMVGRQDFDLTNFVDTKIYFQDKHFDVVIHCAVSGGHRLKEDTYADMDANLCMYYNLVQNRLAYNKLIQFGSGAEIHMENEPYGLSKKVIARSIEGINNFYNLRVFAVFDENELDSRFIKSCIKRYINKEDMEVHNSRKMDFFYMQDLIKVVEYYINNDNLPKEYNCCYEKKYSLLEIAMMINKLDNYKVAICSQNRTHIDYLGCYRQIGIDYIGLEEGIRLTYNKLK